VVDLVGLSVEVSFPLDARAEPGRLIEDADGRVHVVLRGTGELLTIDTKENVAVDRRPVCRAPRGVAYDPANDRVLVACQEGTLVELPAGEGEVVKSTPIAQDLRDVLYAGDQLVLTRFRSAELIYLDADRKIVNRVTPPNDDLGFAAGVAWRAVASPEGEVVVAHQRAFSGVIEVGAEGGVAGAGGESGDLENVAGTVGARPGSAGEPGFEIPPREGYGQPRQPCGSVVESTVTFADTSGGVRLQPRLDRTVLPVDVAVTAEHVVVANAGFSDFTSTGASIGIYPRLELEDDANGCAQARFTSAPPNVVAVAVDATTGRLIAQTREPAAVTVFEPTWDFVVTAISLGGESVFDTGHEIFHADSGAGIACASCHPEGAEDGKVWRFGGFGDRRTQPLDVGLEGTAPFHWDAELPTFGVLMSAVFRDRMGGPVESLEREAALEKYVYSLPRRAAVRVEDAAARRGKAIFESKDVGCAECHSGPKLSTGESADIGLGQAFQIPSLVAVSARAPYMHDGCAATLLDRFDPACGGPRHGHVEDLEPSDLDDLVAYLETL
jgi:mono/diheme cytochrome c family protein